MRVPRVKVSLRAALAPMRARIREHVAPSNGESRPCQGGFVAFLKEMTRATQLYITTPFPAHSPSPRDGRHVAHHPAPLGAMAAADRVQPPAAVLAMSRQRRQRRPVALALIYAGGRVQWSLLADSAGAVHALYPVNAVVRRHMDALATELRTWREVPV